MSFIVNNKDFSGFVFDEKGFFLLNKQYMFIIVFLIIQYFTVNYFVRICSKNTENPNNKIITLLQFHTITGKSGLIYLFS